jgi:hypothetical protein
VEVGAHVVAQRLTDVPRSCRRLTGCAWACGRRGRTSGRTLRDARVAVLRLLHACFTRGIARAVVCDALPVAAGDDVSVRRRAWSRLPHPSVTPRGELRLPPLVAVRHPLNGRPGRAHQGRVVVNDRSNEIKQMSYRARYVE